MNNGYYTFVFHMYPNTFRFKFIKNIAPWLFLVLYHAKNNIECIMHMIIVGKHCSEPWQTFKSFGWMQNNLESDSYKSESSRTIPFDESSLEYNKPKTQPIVFMNGLFSKIILNESVLLSKSVKMTESFFNRLSTAYIRAYSCCLPPPHPHPWPP